MVLCDNRRRSRSKSCGTFGAPRRRDCGARQRVNPTPFVDVERVVFGYDPSRTILNDVSLAFERGKVTAIMGGSGCGKTTLLRLLGGMYRPNRGTIAFDG